MTDKAKNKLYTSDNLSVMRGMNSASVDLIYLDPPFNSKRVYSAPMGSKAAGTEFKDMWTWEEDVDELLLDGLVTQGPELTRYLSAIGDVADKPMTAYCLYMAQRIIEMHRILKPTGSLYLHCDPTASHYLKLILDGVFGRQNFLNEIVWAYRTGGSSKKWFSKKHDTILLYAKTSGAHVFNIIKEKAYTKSANRKPGIINYGAGSAEFFQDEGGVYNFVNMRDIWDISYLNSKAAERTGYPTQKPLAVLHRIIEASSNKGDIVFDPFCGCATTCVAAQQLQRQWIGIDIEIKAVDILQERLEEDSKIFKDFTHIDALTDPSKLPKRTDIVEIDPKDRKKAKPVKTRLYEEQNHKCNGCQVELDEHHFEIDHIIPQVRGGGNHIENFQLLCGHCNRTKGERPMEYLLAKIRKREEVRRMQLSF